MTSTRRAPIVDRSIVRFYLKDGSYVELVDGKWRRMFASGELYYALDEDENELVEAMYDATCMADPNNPDPPPDLIRL